MKLSFVLPLTVLLVGVAGSLAHFAIAQLPTRSPVPANSNSGLRTEDSTTTSDSVAGGLYVQMDGQEQVFPLRHTEVKAQVSGNVSRVEVTQTFENPFDEPLEAVYVFPLPDEAAVDDMEIRIGDRTIRSDIKRREEAQELYQQAIEQGQTAGLLEQERDNIFTQSLANIRPGEQIDVTIRYTESLKFVGGDYEFVFPMVVGPRYIPGTPIDPSGDTDQVPDTSQITPPVLPPEVRSGHDIGVTVDIDAGVSIQDIHSTSHQIRTSGNGQAVRVTLDGEDTIPNKDLILRYRVAGDRTQATVLNQVDERGGHFAVYLIPAVEYDADEIVPKDVVFLMDTSGSQEGDPLAKSQELMRRMINGLNPNDTFTIIDFANTTTQLSAAPLPNTAENRARAIAYINQLSANGGTELLNGIQAVMNFPPAQEGRLRSVVLLTDGYIGNESEVIAEVQRRLSPGNRLYSFGVGSSVNRFLLNRLAEVGRGTVQVVRQDEPTEAVAEQFFQQINNPVLTNIEVRWQGDGEAPEIYPLAAPDLFAEQPLVLFGRKPDGLNGTLQITGTAAGGQRYEQTIPVDFEEAGNEAIAQLWGRFRIKDLMNQMFGGETTTGVEAVTNTALEYRLLSQYTAFVAISEEVRVDPDGTRHRVQVPVELPEGVSYEGIFGSADSALSNSIPGGAMAPSRAMASVGQQDAYEMAPAPLTLRPMSPSPSPTASQLQIVDAEGVDEAELASLEQHLQSVSLPTGFTGDLVLELRLRNGRVERVLLDDQESTLGEAEIVDPVRRSLQAWASPTQQTGTVRLTLRL